MMFFRGHGAPVAVCKTDVTSEYIFVIGLNASLNKPQKSFEEKL